MEQLLSIAFRALTLALPPTRVHLLLDAAHGVVMLAAALVVRSGWPFADKGVPLLATQIVVVLLPPS